MMICEALALEAVVPLSTMSSPEFDSMPFRIFLSGATDDHATALLRLDRRPTSETDVIEAIGEIVTRVGVVLSRWELHHRRDGALIAAADVEPIAIRPLAPLRCVVRLFGSGTGAEFRRDA
jgi:hypothetical protein